MNFALAFAQTLPLRPFRAIEALYWYITGRKMRARNRLRIAKSQTFLAYQIWIDQIEQLPELGARAPEIMGSWRAKPYFSVLVYLPAGIRHQKLAATIKSLASQYYGNLELLVATSDPSLGKLSELPPFNSRIIQASTRTEALHKGIMAANGDYIVPLDAGDRLSPAALFRLAENLQEERPAILYGDEDFLNWLGRRTRSWFKPQWNEEMALAQDYVSSSCAMRTDLAQSALQSDKLPAPTSPYALVLRLTEEEDASVLHIPHILVHRDKAAMNGLSPEQKLEAVAHRLRDCQVELQPGERDSIRVTWPLPADLPMVSIIIPTRDKVKLLRTCVSGVLASTDYPHYEIIIVDNDSIEHETLRYFSSLAGDPRIRIWSYPGKYNYSAINNHAAAHARGEYLCLLNNDTEILDGDWLTELMRQATRPHVGAVGAKLLYADGSIQHAGVVIGMGNAAGHAHRFLRKGKSGYFNRPHIPHYVSAVTAACLVVEKRKFEAVGGLDEENLGIAFNDVDLCLKLQAAGWKNVYTPYATLIHHESKSRGKDIAPKHINRYHRELAVLQKRWNTTTYLDPLHHPDLDRTQESFIIDLAADHHP